LDSVSVEVLQFQNARTFCDGELAKIGLLRNRTIPPPADGGEVGSFAVQLDAAINRDEADL
jgi:hypothetical protein